MQNLKMGAKTALRDFTGAGWKNKCDKLAFVFLFAYVLDCSFSGGGRWLTIGPVSLRMFFAVCALAFSLPELLTNLKKYIKNPILLLTAAFLVYLGISAVRGLGTNYKMNVFMSDLKGFMWLFLVPVAVATVRDQSRFRKLTGAIMLGSVIQICCVLVINTLCYVVFEGIELIELPMYRIGLGTVSEVSYGVKRIFMNSCPYMVIACAIAVFRQLEEKKLRLRYVFLIALNLCAILLSFTRSVYGCVFVVLCCALVALVWFYRNHFKKICVFVGSAAVVTLALVFVLEFAFDASYLNFALSRTLGIQPSESPAVLLREWIVEQTGQPEFEPIRIQKPEEAEAEPTQPALPAEESMPVQPVEEAEPVQPVETEPVQPPQSDRAEEYDMDRYEMLDKYLAEQGLRAEDLTENEILDIFISEDFTNRMFPRPEELTAEQQAFKEIERQEIYMMITQRSDNLRQTTQSELKALIANNPVFGNGLGVYAPSRDTGKGLPSDGLDEYFYLDMLARMGIVGLVLYMLPFGYLAVYALANKKKLIAQPCVVAMLCGMMGFWAITWFNPWMNAALGITGYALCCGIPGVIQAEKEYKI